MQRKKIDSSYIISIGYDGPARIMEVEFKSPTKISKIFQYHEVPPEIFLALDASESKGSYFRSSIAGEFHSEQVD